MTQPNGPQSEPTPAAPRHPLLRVAAACGVAPLLLTLVFVAVYFVDYSPWAPTAELILLVCTPSFLLVGGACLSLANAPARRGPRTDAFARALWRRVALLALNVPAAIAGGLAIDHLKDQTVVVVENRSGRAIDACAIVAVDPEDGTMESRSPIPAQGSFRAGFSLDEEGVVSVKLEQGGRRVEVDVITNTHPIGLKQRVHVGPDLECRIEAIE